MQEREQYEVIVNKLNLDISMHTVKIGSPHRLVLTKSMNSYNRAMKAWREDTELLEKLKRERC